MPYFPRISFKTGILPSLVRSFPTDGQYAGTQRLMLTATRIFGTKIGYDDWEVVEQCVRVWPLSDRFVLAGPSLCPIALIPTKCIATGHLYPK